ncbi:cell wall hydrolase [Bacillus wiedmannii]|uniref:N-acetylmuramoyl-L-alanine amidase C-terminal domain-containing protein n=1 Tax=Bacillus wiedmannii TaxID=1890302 RepID=UPI000BF76118|nr:N-acetylmuramoyl-L-alanine amidase C-terminal domain-containing protein [Bacillus wiedmannii]PGD58090.1 cell wall hydrolase [Bacillus wiedmannii]
MGKLAGSGGHNSIVQGANSIYGKEHVEDRLFLDAVAKYVQAAGWGYVNCSDEVGKTQYDVWNNAANNHLRVVDSGVDLQFHLNATPGGTGCEVWLHPSYGNRELAAKISKAMADAFGLRDRGIKFSTELGWINKTKTGLLPEICFIDNETDMQKYRANFDKAAKAVAEVIVGRSIQSSGTSQPTPPSKQNIIQTGAFSPYEVQEAMQALTSVKMTANFKLQSDGLTYFISDPTSDTQLNAMKGYLDRKGWWYEVK